MTYDDTRVCESYIIPTVQGYKNCAAPLRIRAVSSVLVVKQETWSRPVLATGAEGEL